MNPPFVNILATCRKAELLPGTLLVFDSIRIGFPNADIHVWLNRPELTMPPEEDTEPVISAIVTAAKSIGAELFRSRDYIVHHSWIEDMVVRPSSSEPFWICDTDVVFCEKAEDWEFDEPLAGRFVPEFYDRFTRRMTHGRLHTALMRFDPVEIRKRIADLDRITPEHPFKTKLQLFAPFYYSQLPEPRHWFHDTCSLLYHAVGGQKFTASQKDAYAHLNCGTVLDLVGPAHYGLKEIHERAYADPSSARGLWRQQEAYQEVQ